MGWYYRLLLLTKRYMLFRINYILIIFFILVTSGFADQAESAFGEIFPKTVTAGTELQAFNYKLVLTNGTADSIVINNPMVDHSILVYSITIDGISQLISNQALRPDTTGEASWIYINSKLIVLCDTSAISDSILIDFVQNIPENTSIGNNYNSTYDDVLDPSPPVDAFEIDWSVDIEPDIIASIRIEDSRDGG